MESVKKEKVLTVSGGIYANNLAVLKELFPGVYDQVRQGAKDLAFPLKSFTTKHSQTNAVVSLPGGKQIAFYEGEDIIRSSEKLMDDWQLAAQDMLICVGLGLGYYPLVAAKKFNAGPLIVVIEPHIEIFEFALRSVDLTSLLKYSRLDLFIGSESKAAEIVKQYNYQVLIGNQRVVTHAPSRIIFGESFRSFEIELKESIGLAKDLWHSSKELGKEMLSNMISNLPTLFSSSHLGQVKGAFSGVPAVCVAAGPSLDKAIPVLKNFQGKTLIVAMDSAISTLIRAGIKPHMVVTCDTRKENFEKLRPYLDSLRQSVLVFALESNPDNVRIFPSPLKLAVAGDNSIVRSWLAPVLKIDCNLPAISTVSHTAIFTLMALGVDPIVLVGMDMAFPKEKSHAEHAVNHYNLHSTELIEVQGVKGLPIRTYRPLIDYKKQLEEIISKYPQRVINTSLDGIFIQGTRAKTLVEVVATELNDNDISRILAGITWENSVEEKEIAAVFASMRQRLEGYQDLCLIEIKKIDKIVEHPQRREFVEEWKKHLKDINERYDRFQQAHCNLIEILFSIRLKKIKELEIRRLKLHSNSFAGHDIDNVIEELQIIKDDFSSQHEAAEFFCRLVKVKEDFYLRIQGIVNDSGLSRENRSKQLVLAGIYREAGEIMKAESLYHKVLKNSPEDISVWLDLTRLYADARLWKTAREHIQKACRLFPGNTDVKTMKSEIDDKISGIMDMIKGVWVQGDKDKTRKLLNEYLLFYPEDEQAILLKDVLMELETTLAADSASPREQPLLEKQFEELLVKAGRYIGSLEFEQAIGIIEGLIESFPVQTAILRERIGDCRMLQKDFKSAVFNYERSLSISHRSDEIRDKISKARQGREVAG